VCICETDTARQGRGDQAFVRGYIAAARPLTRLIIPGLGLLTLSGVGWLLVGYQFTPLLVGKIAMVGAIWVLGPIIDNAVEPEFKKLAPGPGEPASPSFIRIQQRYLLLESIATGLFYVIVVTWVLG
jgi:hypothetical protein